MEFFRVTENEADLGLGPQRKASVHSERKNSVRVRATDRVPLPDLRDPFGHIDSQPRRVHASQGIVFEHLSKKDD
jgi:hypothetical protein